MHRIAQRAARLRADRRGITALEYGIMAGWLSAIIIYAFIRFGTQIGTNFANVGSSI